MSKIKVCHITTSHNRYDNRIFVKECTSLAKHNYDVTLLCTDGIKNEILNNVNIINIGNSRKNTFSRLIEGPKMIKKYLKNTEFDIYHFHDPELINVAYSISKSGKVVVFDSHEDYISSFMDKKIFFVLKKLLLFFLNFIQSRTFKNCFALITVSPHIEKKIKKYNKNVYVVENFPILSDKVKKYNNNDTLICCFAGGLSKQWSHQNIISSINSISDVEYKIAGTNFNNDYMHKLCEINKYEKAKFLGKLTHDEVKQLYLHSDVGIALNDYVGNVDFHNGSLGNTKIFEYMESGLPLIATDFTLWKDIIEGNKCGICVNPNNISEISEAIKFLKNHRELLKEYGKNGRKAVEKKYNWQVSERKLLNLYNMIERKLKSEKK